MTKHPPTTAHNYLKRLVDMGLVTGGRQVRDVDVRHDDWCDATNGRGFCNCDPEISIRPTKGSSN